MNQTRTTQPALSDVLSRVLSVMDTQHDDNGEPFREGNPDLYREIQALTRDPRTLTLTEADVAILGTALRVYLVSDHMPEANTVATLALLAKIDPIHEGITS